MRKLTFVPYLCFTKKDFCIAERIYITREFGEELGNVPGKKDSG
jgi:hypothetical protein